MFIAQHPNFGPRSSGARCASGMFSRAINILLLRSKVIE
jgi:hypothetical protein